MRDQVYGELPIAGKIFRCGYALVGLFLTGEMGCLVMIFIPACTATNSNFLTREYFNSDAPENISRRTGEG